MKGTGGGSEELSLSESGGRTWEFHKQELHGQFAVCVGTSRHRPSTTTETVFKEEVSYVYQT
jgi:hypothetical protein